MLLVSPTIVALQPGATASVVLTDTLNSPLTVPTLPTGSVNNAPMFSTSVPTTDLVWPISVSVTASVVAAGGGQATFTFTDSTGTVQTAVVTIAVVPIVANVPNGRTSTAAIATVRRRTNLVFGEPSDSDILAMLNDGLEQFTTDAEPILSSTSIPITSPGTNILAFPPDVERPRDANYSTGVISSPGTIVYPMDQRDYDEFVLETDQSPVGGIGGIPTIYTLIQDTSGVQLIQFYVYANSGYVNKPVGVAHGRRAKLVHRP